ncbi:MAG: hypothetical protein ACD_31C00087G0003 [uncultured bacterium]|nr:MAG: hypothetical protein ACD_31C00087G0003 [uncultured bacterium]
MRISEEVNLFTVPSIRSPLWGLTKFVLTDFIKSAIVNALFCFGKDIHLFSFLKLRLRSSIPLASCLHKLKFV